MKKNLMLRGTVVLLGRALAHVGKGHRVDEWGDGRYANPAIEAADSILRLALCKVQRKLENS